MGNKIEFVQSSREKLKLFKVIAEIAGDKIERGEIKYTDQIACYLSVNLEEYFEEESQRMIKQK